MCSNGRLAIETSIKNLMCHTQQPRSFGAYSFCAVFLFRFINRNRNRRVQKERLSFERNNFHGNKMAQCLISNWKGKSTKTYIYENENSKKKYGRQTSCLRRPRYLLRSFSSVFERVFMVTSRKWRAAAVLTAVSVEGKSGEKNAGQDEGEFVVLFVAAAVLRRRRARRRLFSRLLTKTRKETKKRRCSSIKKKHPDPLVCSCIAEQFSTSCRVPACGKPT